MDKYRNSGFCGNHCIICGKIIHDNEHNTITLHGKIRKVCAVCTANAIKFIKLEYSQLRGKNRVKCDELERHGDNNERNLQI